MFIFLFKQAVLLSKYKIRYETELLGNTNKQDTLFHKKPTSLQPHFAGRDY